MDQPIRTIHLEHVCKSFTLEGFSRPVLDNITYSFQKGNSYAIIGKSGSGKSTLLHCIAGLEPITSGTVLFNNSPLSDNLSQRQKFLHNNIGLMFQAPYLIQELSVIDNVLLEEIDDDQQGDIRQRAVQLLEEIGLSNKKNDPAWTLSGGQQQRVALARAILKRPDFLLADEPTGNLDPETGVNIIKLIKKYQALHGIGIIIATHDPHVIELMDIHVVVQNGTLQKKV